MGRWRRLARWLNDHPLAVRAVFIAVALAWTVAVVVDRQFDRLPMAVLYLLVGVVGLGRKTLRVSHGRLTVPNRWWGGRTLDADDIACFEVPESVWSTDPSFVVLAAGERLVLRGADRFRARELADALATPIRPLRPDSAPPGPPPSSIRG